MTACLIDLGNVLVGFDHRRACRDLAGLSRRTLSGQEVYRAVFGSGLEAQFDEGAIDTRSFLARLRSDLDLSGDDEAIETAWCDIFWPNPDVIALLPRLKPRTLLLASNTNPLHFGWVCRHYPDAVEPFRHRVLSWEVRTRKPAPAFYERCLSVIGRPAAECVYVDDRADYVAVAREMGLRGIVYEPGMDLELAILKS